MRNLYELDHLRQYGPRVIETMGSAGDHGNGAFIVHSVIDRAQLLVVASNGEGWDHVSVSRRNRPPNWTEMEQVAKLFFAADEVAVQYHVPATEHVNAAVNALHWWRPQHGELPRPSMHLVGGGGNTPIRDNADAEERRNRILAGIR